MVDDSARWLSVLRQLPCPKSILELGCGDCRDLAAYAVAYAKEPTGILIASLDHDFAALRTARKSYPSVPLIQADVRQLPIRQQFDLIVARHPDVDRQPLNWAGALQHGADQLTERGILLITVYSMTEAEQIERWLSTCNLVPFALESARLSPPGLSGRDRFILVYRSYNN